MHSWHTSSPKTQSLWMRMIPTYSTAPFIVYLFVLISCSGTWSTPHAKRSWGTWACSNSGRMTTKMTEQLGKFKLGIRKHFSRRVVQPWDKSRGENPSLESLKNGYHHAWNISRFDRAKSQLTSSGISDCPALKRRLHNRPAASC